MHGRDIEPALQYNSVMGRLHGRGRFTNVSVKNIFCHHCYPTVSTSRKTLEADNYGFTNSAQVNQDIIDDRLEGQQSHTAPVTLGTYVVDEEG